MLNARSSSLHLIWGSDPFQTHMVAGRIWLLVILRLRFSLSVSQGLSAPRGPPRSVPSGSLSRQLTSSLFILQESLHLEFLSLFSHLIDSGPPRIPPF